MLEDMSLTLKLKKVDQMILSLRCLVTFVK